MNIAVQATGLPHPLDPLSPAEVAEAARIVRSHRDLGSGMRFETIMLAEPSFAAAARSEESDTRRAFVSVYDIQSGDLFEAVVALDRGSVLSWTPRPGAKPRIAAEEFMLADNAVKSDPRFLAALTRRGIDPTQVRVDPWSAGVFGCEDEVARRVVQGFVFFRSNPYDNQYAHPVEGLTAIVDINRGEVIRVDDTGILGVPLLDRNYAARFQKSWRTDLKPIEIVQPEGPSYVVDGNQVTWCEWRLRVGFTPREGLVLHDIAIRDKDRWRPVIKRASLAEMVVPYGSPQGVHPRKNAFDCGDYGIGALANSLSLGCDCLGVIHYFDAVINRIDGSPHVIPNAVCLHEEDSGILWKHHDFRTEETDTRRGRRLVVSFIATVGNYEYGFYWYFYLDGTIQLEVKLTGVIYTAAVPIESARAYGTEVSPGVIGQIHQHLFNVRLDMAVDGARNTVVEVDTIVEPPGPDNPWNNGFRAVETPLVTEKAARRNADAQKLRYWKIVNPHSRNSLGQPVAYRLLPESAIKPMNEAGSQVARRAGFVSHHLWVTPTRDEERWPAGDYVNQSADGEGLPAWTEADRPVDDTQITVWHTFGHHHLPRPEDFPVQPVTSCGFKLQPFGFFDQNPTLDVPPSAKGASCCA